MINRFDAENMITAVFKHYGAIYRKRMKTIGNFNIGKTYELYTIALLVEEFSMRNYSVNYSHPNMPLAFKAGSGSMNTDESHFILTHKNSGKKYYLFANVEFETLGSRENNEVNDYSKRHELDVGIFTCCKNGYPTCHEVALGIECKAVTKLTKQMVRGMLGLRRELSFYREYGKPSVLSGGLPQPADPPSELRLYSTDARITKYMQSPAVFGIEMKHMKP